ncbi:hypothetical protein [Legionella maioricensis]|uniref:Uncharacterized protein n=1 Tax=Legionella maioricensis TaxID=2896528 RepID=A0A9X2D2K1_9GAMM|nr:hypothetical protein [Legionella maioricensis]MCL9684885.1 hypothetical protein [Legionella maioricensis]MCL9688961.1 hypothetical protein [Legionella maioricensis]
MKNLPPSNRPQAKKKWSFIETSQKNIKNQEKKPSSTENDNERINQADNLSEGEPESKDLWENISSPKKL